MRAKIDQARSIADERLPEEEFNTRLEILNLRFKLATHQLTDFSELRSAKRRLAHILTVQWERRTAGDDA